MRTAVSVPDGGTILLGGMADPGAGSRPATGPAAAAVTTQPAAARPGRRLYLMVKPQIIRQGKVEQQQFPPLNRRTGG